MEILAIIGIALLFPVVIGAIEQERREEENRRNLRKLVKKKKGEEDA